MIQIKAKSRTGQIIDLSVEEIIEIDGKLYHPTDEIIELTALVNHLSGRLAAVEAFLGAKQE